MAVPIQPVGYICRSCRQSLVQNRSTYIRHTRQFSNSRPHSKTLATFTPTSSPELDATLSSWRNQIFLPSILPPHHQKLLYKTSRHEILTSPPGIIVAVQPSLPPSADHASAPAEELIKLQPMNRWNRPNKQKGLQTIVNTLGKDSSAATWDNLIPFLEGCRLARYSIPVSRLSQIARKANIQGDGRWNTLLTAAAMAKRTGFVLSLQPVTRELMNGALIRGLSADFKTTEPAKTVERVILMLEQEEHHGNAHSAIEQKDSKQKAEPSYHADMRRDPVVLAVKLSFSSAQVIRNDNAKDEDGKVADDLRKLLALNDTLKGGLIGYIEESLSQKQTKDVADRELLQNLTTLYCALGLADKVDFKTALGKDTNSIKATLKKQSEAVKQRIATCAASVRKSPTDRDGRTRRSLQTLEATEKALKGF